MFRVRDMITGDLRERVDELLDAVADTNDTIDKLRESIDRLTAALQSGARPDQSTISALRAATADWARAANAMKESVNGVREALDDLKKRLGR